jgi:hypothetical protein
MSARTGAVTGASHNQAVDRMVDVLFGRVAALEREIRDVRAQINDQNNTIMLAMSGTAGAPAVFRMMGVGVEDGTRVVLAELSGDADAPASNHVTIYAKDVGGKSALFARFATGAAQQIAIEP